MNYLVTNAPLTENSRSQLVNADDQSRMLGLSLCEINGDIAREHVVSIGLEESDLVRHVAL
jgi:hypothetical protein